MPPRKDRDFPVSQYYAAEIYEEQRPRVRRKPPPPPNERTIWTVLKNLRNLVDFEPPLKNEGTEKPVETEGDNT